MELHQLLEKIIEGYKHLSSVRALALVGSHARGTATSSSGVDIMAVSFTITDLPARRKVVNTLADSPETAVFLETPVPMDQFHMDGKPVMVWHVGQDVICERVSSIDKLQRLNSPMLVASLHESQIIWDPRRQLKAWRDRINPIPAAYKTEVIPMIFGEIISVLSDLKDLSYSDNCFYYQHEMIAAAGNLYELLFLINGRYFNLTRRIHDTASLFKKMPGQVLPLLMELLLTRPDTNGARKQWRLLARVTEELGTYIDTHEGIRLGENLELLRQLDPSLTPGPAGRETQELELPDGDG